LKLIEFTGIPGSGKSTIVPIVKSYLKEQGLDIFDAKNVILCGENFHFIKKHFKSLLGSLPMKIRKKILRGLNNYSYLKHEYTLNYILNNLQLFNYIVDRTKSRPIPERHKNLIIEWFLNMAASYQIAHEFLEKNSVLLLDEGFVHKVVSLFVFVEEATVDFDEIERYLENIPRGHLLIRVEANENVCKKRIINRKLPSRLNGRTDNEIWQYLIKAKSAIDYTQNFLAKRGTKIVTLNNFDEEFSRENIVFQLSRNFRDF
jgi:hypothetical protein